MRIYEGSPRQDWEEVLRSVGAYLDEKGLRGLVFKSHGSADEMAFGYALDRAYDAARNNLLDRVRARIAHAAPLLARKESAAPAQSWDSRRAHVVRERTQVG